ncbi:MAG TPA: prepilin peptidase [Blastocatellia bacterium]|nr:prepilin peptidase [Blastocatellia bacterium]
MENLPSYFIGFAVFFLGLIIGSFLNVVIYRVPLRESVVSPGSRCPGCNTDIKAYDNIPVISYAILGGRCRNCGIGISIIYPAVELLVGLLYLLLFLKDGLSLLLPADIVFVSLIVPLVFIDLRHKILPDAINYPGLLLMIILRVIAPDPVIIEATRATWHLTAWPVWAVSLAGSALGAAVGGGSLLLVREGYFRLRRVEGMGLGDVKMMLMVGAFLGWQLTLLTIFLASLLGSLIGIGLISMRGGSMKMEIPFGVFLGPAAIISLFAGQPLIRWYIGFFN